MQSMYERFSKGQRLTDSDTKTLDASFAVLDKQLSSQQDSLKDLVALQGKQQDRAVENIKSQTKYLPIAYANIIGLALFSIIMQVLR
ncbi:MAG: hypothetical protein HC765_11665 [Brachymonas sp.]|nr:hypothetical protein [Brachymonas sp.]